MMQSLSLESQKLQKRQKGGKGLLCPFPMRDCSALDSHKGDFFSQQRSFGGFRPGVLTKRPIMAVKSRGKIEARKYLLGRWQKMAAERVRLPQQPLQKDPNSPYKQFTADQISELFSWDDTPTPSRSTESLAVAAILEPIRLEPKLRRGFKTGVRVFIPKKLLAVGHHTCASPSKIWLHGKRKTNVNFVGHSLISCFVWWRWTSSLYTVHIPPKQFSGALENTFGCFLDLTQRKK